MHSDARVVAPMDWSSIPLALVSPLAPGGEILRGVRLLGASSDLGLQLRFDARGVDLLVDIEPVDEHRPHAARSRYFQYSYRISAQPAVGGDWGRALCEAVAKIASANEEAIVEAIQRVGQKSKSAPVRIREVSVSRALEVWGQPGERYYTLSPYVGCLIGCRFCYAQTRLAGLRRLQGLPTLPWGSWVDARVNIAERLAEELPSAKPWPVKFCPIVSDPYHAVERQFRLTRACLRALRDSATTRAVIVLTRSSSIREDADLLGALPLGYGGVSLPTIDDEVRRHFEPRGAPIEERLESLRVLKAAGARVFAIVQPLLPGNLVALADALAETVQSVRIDVLHGVVGAEREFEDRRYTDAARGEWQAERASRLAQLLIQRSVEVWPGELPPPELPSR